MSDNSNPAPTTSATSQRPLTGQEYLEQLRQRRLESRPAATIPTPEPVMAREQTTPPITAPPIESQTTTEPVVPQDSDQQTESAYDNSTEQSDNTNLFPGIERPMPEEDVFMWRAASRPFKKRDRQYYTTIAAIVFLISLILFFAGQFLPIAVVVSVGFLAYVLSSVPPTPTDYKLTTYGIRVENNLYLWDEVGRFWFDEKFGQDLVHIETARFPGRLTMVLGEISREELRNILSEVLLEEKPQPTFFDKAAQWLQDKIPLEVSSK